MGIISLSLPVIEELQNHLACIEEEKDHLMNRIFPHISQERTDFERDLAHYADQLSRLIKTAKKSENSGNDVPFVVIGSEVTVLDLKRKKPLKFKLIGPCNESKSGCISCMSPVGRSLILRKVDEEVAVEVPAGLFQYRVQEIHM
ncbi:MAG: transcription elongation factor GreAB [Syntrophomonadaceae bacterium]|nr:transcription elongation factor GreAB [Syntrophomonadaceae bacterium]